MERFGLSERKSCRLVKLNRSTNQYRSKQRDDSKIRERIRELADRYKRYGSPRIHALLRREGIVINHKRTERIYAQEGLALRRKKGKKLSVEARVPMVPAERVNQVWSMDFISDSLASGKRFRALTIIDDFTRLSPGIEVSTSLPGQRVTRFLDELALSHGYPERIRVDNGPEFVSKDFTLWAASNKIEVEYIRPGKPSDNGYIESFNGKFRDECLNQHWFINLKQTKDIIENWGKEYNHERPHSSLGNCTPYEFVLKHKTMLNTKSLNLHMA
jgi:putative transposase